MKNRTLALLMALLFSCGPVQADMIEIKGRGVLNGKIVSQDENGVQFKESGGGLLTVPKADVLFLEAQKDAPASAARPVSFLGSSGWLKKIRSNATQWFSQARYEIRKFTEKTRELVSKPLDRSDADAKAKQLADTMDETADAVRKMSARNKAQATNQRVKFYAESDFDLTEAEKTRKGKGVTYKVSKDAQQFSLN